MKAPTTPHPLDERVALLNWTASKAQRGKYRINAGDLVSGRQAMVNERLWTLTSVADRIPNARSARTNIRQAGTNAGERQKVIAGGFNEAENPPFQVFQPAQQRVPFIFNAPHSGRIYPDELRNASPLTSQQLRRSEDVLVDQLFECVVEIGAPFLVARFPRAWLDVNREPYELDPKLFAERLPGHANIRSMRVSGGLGTVPRLVAENLEIYSEKLSLNDALHRIETIYRPYHETLRKLMAQSVVTFGHAVLVDCHSMPSRGARNENAKRADIIIGDRYGTSCNGEISRNLIRRFADRGYSVTRNKPYAGGFITEHYGRPLKGLHAIQIEINRALYLDETTLRPTAGFDALRGDIASIMAHFVSQPDSGFEAAPIAAE